MPMKKIAPKKSDPKALIKRQLAKPGLSAKARRKLERKSARIDGKPKPPRRRSMGEGIISFK